MKNLQDRFTNLYLFLSHICLFLSHFSFNTHTRLLWQQSLSTNVRSCFYTFIIRLGITSSWFHSLLMSSFVSCSTNRKFLKTTRSFRNPHEAFHPILHQKWATGSNQTYQTQLTWNIILKSSQDQLCMPNVYNVHCTYSITNGK